MYIVLALVMLLRGFADAIMMRIQQAIAFNSEARATSTRITTTRSSLPTA
jgi:heme/copper-type cytochrome/quinol oxidase subunit 1